MAITKIHAIKSTLGKALAYIENPDKTDGQMLVSGYNCEPQTASIDFEMTAVLAHKARNLKRKRSTNLAYHLIQSFSPEDAVAPCFHPFQGRVFHVRLLSVTFRFRDPWDRCRSSGRCRDPAWEAQRPSVVPDGPAVGRPACVRWRRR